MEGASEEWKGMEVGHRGGGFLYSRLQLCCSRNVILLSLLFYLLKQYLDKTSGRSL